MLTHWLDLSCDLKFISVLLRSILGLKQAADDGEDEYGKEAADFKRNDFYVDDRLQSVPNVEKAVKGFVAMQD